MKNLKSSNIGMIYVNFHLKQNVCKLYNFNEICPSNSIDMSFLGGLQSTPPEILKGEKYTYKSDIWNLGILIYEMMTGTSPFQKKSKKQILEDMI